MYNIYYYYITSIKYKTLFTIVIFIHLLPHQYLYCCHRYFHPHLYSQCVQFCQLYHQWHQLLSLSLSLYYKFSLALVASIINSLSLSFARRSLSVVVLSVSLLLLLTSQWSIPSYTLPISRRPIFHSLYIISLSCSRCNWLSIALVALLLSSHDLSLLPSTLALSLSLSSQALSISLSCRLFSLSCCPLSLSLSHTLLSSALSLSLSCRLLLLSLFIINCSSSSLSPSLSLLSIARRPLTLFLSRRALTHAIFIFLSLVVLSRYCSLTLLLSLSTLALALTFCIDSLKVNIVKQDAAIIISWRKRESTIGTYLISIPVGDY